MRRPKALSYSASVIYTYFIFNFFETFFDYFVVPEAL